MRRLCGAAAVSWLTDSVMLGRAITAHRAPFKLTVAVTYVCDQRCTHCRIWRRGRTDELDAAEWRRVWRAASDTLSWIDLTGGEVTSRPDFAEIAIAAVEECSHLAMLHYPSNGRRPEVLEQVTRAILGAGPRRLVLSLSLDGPRETHDRLRGDPGAFDHAMDSYRRIRALGVEVYFGMTLSPWNVELLDATQQAIRDEIPGFGWRDLHVNFLHESDHYFGNTGIERNDPDRLRAVIERFIERRGLARHPTQLLERLYLKHVPEHLATGRSPLKCSSLKSHGFIDPTGRVYPCHIWDEPVGRLRDHHYSLSEIWALERTRAVRAEVEADRCPGCWTPCEAYPTILANLPGSML